MGRTIVWALIFTIPVVEDEKTTCDISEDGLNSSSTCLSSPNLTLRKTRSGSDVGLQVEC
jgi:hypothetical protein